MADEASPHPPAPGLGWLIPIVVVLLAAALVRDPVSVAMLDASVVETWRAEETGPMIWLDADRQTILQLTLVSGGARRIGRLQALSVPDMQTRWVEVRALPGWSLVGDPGEFVLDDDPRLPPGSRWPSGAHLMPIDGARGTVRLLQLPRGVVRGGAFEAERQAHYGKIGVVLCAVLMLTLARPRRRAPASDPLTAFVLVGLAGCCWYVGPLPGVVGTLSLLLIGLVSAANEPAGEPR